MAALHALTALAALIGLVVLVGLAVLSASGRRISRSIVDGIIVIVLVGVGLGALTGAILPTQGAGPRDPLHALYAVAALLTLPFVRAVGARRDPPTGLLMSRGLGRWMAVGSLGMFGILLRLWQTG